MRTVLIDADIIVYRAAWACQKTHYTHTETGEFFDGKKKAKDWWQELHETKAIPDWEGEWDIVEEIEPWENCKFILDNYIKEIMKNTKADSKILYLSDKPTFRHELATIQEYKGNRQPGPHLKDEAREYILKRYKAIVGKNLEADDMLGLNQTEETAIASYDKDLLMIPGKHYNIVTQERSKTSVEEGKRRFFSQLIAGDRVDNIKGVPGFATTLADKFIANFKGDYEELVSAISGLYDEHYPETIDGDLNLAMVETAQLVYILQAGDTPGNEKWREWLKWGRKELE